MTRIPRLAIAAAACAVLLIGCAPTSESFGTADLEALTAPESPFSDWDEAGPSPDDEGATGDLAKRAATQAADDAFDTAECVDLYTSWPLSSSRDADSDDPIRMLGWRSSGDDTSYVQAYARLFDSAAEASDHQRDLAETVTSCADGYSGSTFTTESVTATADSSEQITDSALNVAGWHEVGANTDGTAYDYYAQSYSFGNIVIRATCYLQGADTERLEDCAEYTDRVSLQLAILGV